MLKIKEECGMISLIRLLNNKNVLTKTQQLYIAKVKKLTNPY